MTKYPIYIISKGRWLTPYTARSLDEMSIEYLIVVEPNEYDNYKKVINKEKILIAPEDFSKKGQGSIPVRNFVWEHSMSNGHIKHWLLDDNIRGFERLNRNKRGKVYNDGMFLATESFVDRYTNIAFAGFEYRQFGGGARRKKPPFKMNYRVYSCTLINNTLKYRWRGKYNEDTDICLRALKDGWVTITFNCFLQNKISTMQLKGGNTDTIYNTGDQRLEFAKSLERQHPDVVKVVWRYNRWHHDVDYKPFSKNELIFKPNYIQTKEKINNFNMTVIEID